MELYQVLEKIRKEYDGRIEPIVTYDDIYSTTLKLTLGSSVEKHMKLALVLEISKLPFYTKAYFVNSDKYSKSKIKQIDVYQELRDLEHIGLVLDDYLFINESIGKYFTIKDNNIIMELVNRILSLISPDSQFSVDIINDIIRIKNDITFDISISYFTGFTLDVLCLLKGITTNKSVENNINFKVIHSNSVTAEMILKNTSYENDNGLLIIPIHNNIKAIIESKKNKYKIYLKLSDDVIIPYKKVYAGKLLFEINKLIKHDSDIQKYILAYIAGDKFNLNVCELKDETFIEKGFLYCLKVNNQLIEENLSYIINRLYLIYGLTERK